MSRTQSEKPASTSDVIGLLRRHGISPTRQRVEIGEMLFCRNQHVTAEDVLDQVNRTDQTVSKATVYNTLGLFASKGLLKEVVVDPTKRFYDTNLLPHHHLFHTDQGHLEDIDANHIKVDGLPAIPRGMEVEGVDVIIRVRST
ncbi:MAG: transcriptional repressor [Gammaproteobacteria bacterium]|jgi:Fur family iron response transcriptional regulator|nr:transcriptional repressor [Gammaproteobacteria bacterium]